MTNWQIYHLLALILGGKNLEEHVDELNFCKAWPQLIELSSHQMVTTQAAFLLKNNSTAWSKIQQDEADYFEEIVHLNTERNKQIIQQTLELITALNQAGISPLIMKGTAALLSSNQVNLGYRMQIDIDILVRPRESEKSILEIKKLGYQYAKENEKGLIVISPKKESLLLSLYQNHKHFPPFIRNDNIAAVELHRHLYIKQYQKYYSLDPIFDRAKHIEDNSLSWLQMSPEDELQLLLIGGYIEPRLKPSYSLPLKLLRDYLDIKQSSNTGFSNLEAFGRLKSSSNSLSLDKLDKKKRELEQLILLVSGNLDNQDMASSHVRKYLFRFQQIVEKPRAHRLAHNRAAFIRKLINLSHDPRLMLRYII